MNEPIYKIHGLERRELKKELSELKRFVKNFWHYHQLDKDMYSFYNCDSSNLMSDTQANVKVNKVSKQIEEIEEKLSILYNN